MAISESSRDSRHLEGRTETRHDRDCVRKLLLEIRNSNLSEKPRVFNYQYSRKVRAFNISIFTFKENSLMVSLSVSVRLSAICAGRRMTIRFVMFMYRMMYWMAICQQDETAFTGWRLVVRWICALLITQFSWNNLMHHLVESLKLVR